MRDSLSNRLEKADRTQQFLAARVGRNHTIWF
jgi:hypothetical protein